jgi:alkylation response protein AidB-like acyl-CoA dehydrogenase
MRLDGNTAFRGRGKAKFDLTTETREIFERARRFAEARLANSHRCVALDRIGWGAAAEFGVFRFAAASTKNASGRGALASVAMLEGMGRGGADRGLLFAIGAHLFGCLVPLSIYARPSQSERWEGPLRDGTVIGALAVTEAGGGSSFENIETTVVEHGDGYVLTGRKSLIGNAPEAGVFLVLARQFPDRGPLGLTALLVPADTRGLTVTPIATTGLAGLPMGDVVFDHCPVPADTVLGGQGAGFRVFATAMQWERTCLLSGFLGASERDLVACLATLRGRGDRQGSLLRHQAVAHRLARVKLGLDSARLLVYRAANYLDEGRADHAAAAMAKLAVSEATVAAAENGLRLMAGLAWRDQPINYAAALSDSLGGLSASGTTEIQLEIVARSMQGDASRGRDDGGP